MYLTWVKSPNFGYPRGKTGRNGYKVIAIVDHIMAGTLRGTDSWFQNPKSKASAHFGIGKDGTVHQYVDVDNAAWANGDVKKARWPLLIPHVNPNLYTVSIEHEGYPGDKMPETQYQATLLLHKLLISRFGLPVNRDTIIGHYRINSVDRANCPGPTFPWDRLFHDLENPAPPTAKTTLRLRVGGSEIIKNGTEHIRMNIPVKIENGYVVGPLRPIAEALGATVYYEDTTKEVTVTM